MSKLLAMMMKPKNYMYATIKGSLTENNGVFSGFSTSNYLELNKSLNLSTEKVEIVLDIKLTSFSNDGLCILSANNGLNIQLYRQSTQYKLLNLGGNANSGTKQFVLNTNYKVKFVITSTTLDMYVWENNNWILDVSYTVNYTTISNIVIGDNYTHSGTRVFTGSIDLNQSYIKINNTKYQLQAVVGYTVVGNPTITDGVVSGFSSANYLKINVPTDIYYNTFELCVKFKTTDNSISQRLFINAGNLYITISSGILSLNYYNTNNNWSSRNSGSLSNDNWYWYKIKFDIINKFLIAERSTDGINYTQVLNSQNISNINENIRIRASGIAFCDQDNNQYTELGISETYIKINNKLWFNGQPA